MVQSIRRSYKFNEIIPFDKWKTTVLTKIKGYIPEEGGAVAAKQTEGEGDIELWFAWLVWYCQSDIYHQA